MSQLFELVSELYSDERSRFQAIDSLRALGFRGSVVGLRRIVEFSSSLQFHFEQLEEIFPNVKRILQDFQRSAEIQASLQRAQNFPVGELVKSNYHSTKFCQSIGSKNFKPVDVAKFPIIGELIAFFWLCHSSLYAVPGITISKEALKLLIASLSFSENAAYVAEDFPEIVNQSHQPFFNNIDEWGSFVAPIFEQVWSISGLSAEEAREGFEQCVQLIRKLNPETTSENFDDDVAEWEQRELEIESSSSSQRVTGLSERERLTIHHNAFQDSEMQTLSADLRLILETKETEFRLSEVGVMPEDFFEAMIITASLVTGRTILGALKMTIQREPLSGYRSRQADSDALEQIYLKNLIGYQGNFYHPMWERKISQSLTLSLPLPSYLTCLKSKSVYFDEVSKLEDCLPYSLIPWEQRCHEWLRKKLRGSKYLNNRKIRDALSRALYFETANPALLTWLTTPINKISKKAESLSNYLNPAGERTVESYRMACEKIFSEKYGVEKKIRELSVKSEWGFTKDELRSIAKIFKDSVQNARDARDPIEIHNSIARYLLMLLIVTAGHRKSRTPFYFSWDVLPDENLVFISDKQVVGSEARLVPIPKWITEQIIEYRSHLVKLYRYAGKDHEILASILRQILPDIEGWLGKREVRRKKKTGVWNSQDIGFFFTLDKHYNPHPIATSDLERCYVEITAKGIRNFRKNIADYLWGKGLSGQQVEAFLGHNAEMHGFGESSSWSIIEWAQTIREVQEVYLQEHGWAVIPIDYSQVDNTVHWSLVPDFKKSMLSYEGRYLTNNYARAKAKAVIRDQINPEWYRSESAQITEADIRAFKATVEKHLENDLPARNKISEMLAREINILKGIHGKDIYSALLNWTRTEPGPIDVSLSRHHAIASSVRRWWLENLGNYSTNIESSFLDRAAAIGISLVIFDAIVDMSTLEALLVSLIRGGARKASECVLIRAEIRTRTRIYDKTLVVTQQTAAQIVGFESVRTGKPSENLKLGDVKQRIVKILKAAPNADGAIQLDKLTTIFRAWWLPRLPGVLNAIAVGRYSGPAPDVLSECAVYGYDCGDQRLPNPKDDAAKILMPRRGESGGAQKLINRLLSEARGDFEKKQGTSKSQRKRLIQQLYKKDSHAELKQLAAQVQIVSVMLDFLQVMLDEGGKKVRNLRFNTIATYFSHISELIDSLWDRPIEQLEEDDFDAMYRELKQKSVSTDRGTAIELFHRYLRENYNVPYSSVAMSNSHQPSQCRSSLVTPEQFGEAWSAIKSISDDGQLIRHTLSFLSLEQQYGLRTKETLGLSLGDIVSEHPFSIHVRRNGVRDLKTRGKASFRVASPSLQQKALQTHLGGVVSMLTISRSGNNSLFEDTGNRNQIYPVHRITQAATSALRAGTGNLSVVPYSLRHSVATRLAHFHVCSPRQIPISEVVDTTLKGEINPNDFMKGFKQGFSAWPFWMDRVGMYLGHTGVDTLLNTYWHSSHIRLAEYTWRASEGIKDMKPVQIANMLNKERSTIHRRLEGSNTANSKGVRTKFEEVVSYYVEKSTIPRINTGLEPQKSNSDNLNAGFLQFSEANSWIAFDRLLSERLKEDLSFEELENLGKQLNISKRRLDGFIDDYKFVVQESEFTDFEPPSSELLIGPPRRDDRALRGSIERGITLTQAQRLYLSSKEFQKNLDRFLKLWLERVNASAPWFIAKSVEELAFIIELLVELGATREQIEYCSCNFEISSLGKLLTKTEIDSVKEVRIRLSKGRESIKTSEVGVRIRQSQGSLIGDYRDTHRLVIVLAAIVLGIGGE